MNYGALTVLSASEFRTKWQNCWNVTMNDGMPRYLLRGQNSFYLTDAGLPSIISYFARLPDDPLLIGQVFTTFRRASQLCTVTWGYHVGHEDALAVLQHYGWRTPSIDFTGTADVALSFALHPAPQTPVIYVLDRESLPAEVTVSEHNFLIAPPDSAGLASRWWRQDGFGVMNRTWREADTSRKFNLFEAVPDAIQVYAVYSDTTVSRTTYEDLLTLSNDPHPRRVQDVLRLFCAQQFEEQLHPELRATIESICP